MAKERLDAVVNLRLTQTEKKRLLEQARLAGVSVSHLVRQWICHRQVLPQTDTVLINELRRLGELLKKIDYRSQGAYGQEIRLLLQSIANWITQLSYDR